MHDVVISNGMVVDGSGGQPFQADVAISDGRIVDIGRITDRAHQQIDAEGHVVSPGFIDGHTHMDAQVMWDPLGTCSCWHGVTTVVMGNCGFTLAPARVDQRAMVVRNIERAEDIAAEAIAAGVEWRWETFPEFLDALDATPMGINYAANIGHCALRTFAMGERAFEEEATEDDLAAMLSELSAALQAGAIGFTTTRSSAHATPDDRPVASRLATWDEVRRLVSSMSAAGRRVFELTPEVNPGGDPDAFAADYERIIELALETGVPTTFGLFGSPTERRGTLRRLEKAVSAGADMFVLTHSRGISTLLSLRSRLPFDRLPEWRDIRSRPIEAQLAALRDPTSRQRLVDVANNGDYGTQRGPEPRKPTFASMGVLLEAAGVNPTIAELAAARSVDPLELMIDLMIESNGDQFFVQSLSPVDESVLAEGMKHPLSVMTFSDSGAHVSQIMDSSIQTHLLSRWVRDRKEFTIEEAVRMITAVPARAFGFSDRGLLREGMVADVNIFDPSTVGPNLPTVETDLPGGAMRLKQTATGFLATLVAGEVLLSNGHHTGALPGRLIRASS